MKRKILLTLMIIMINIISFGTVSASAETYGDLTYTVSNGEVMITQCKRDATNITIPEFINGFPVVTIKEYAFQSCNGLTELVIPDSVTYVGKSAFSRCGNLESVKIGDGLTTIEESTFIMCAKLSKVDIGSEIKTIGRSAFAGCGELTEIYIPDNVEYIGQFAFSVTNIKNVHIGSGVKGIESHAFPHSVEIIDIKDINAYLNIDFEEDANVMDVNPPASLYLNGNPITNVVIPDGIIHIPDYVFQGCNELESVTIPSSVKRIGEGAFENCISLTSVSIPDSVLFVDDYAFAGCSGITQLQIGNNVKSIGERAFADCINIKNLSLPDSVESISYGAFDGCESLKKISFGENIKYIGSYAFADINVEEVSISDIMFYWAELPWDFMHRFSDKIVLNGNPITSVVIPDGVTYIPDNAFEDCSTLESVTIPEGVAVIGNSAFRNCDNLLEISIPYSTIKIGESAFASCDKLESVTILNNATTIGAGAFSDCYQLADVDIPETLSFANAGSAFEYTPYRSALESDSYGIVYMGDLLVRVTDKTLSEYRIKEGTKAIGYAAFEGCTNVESIIIPDSVNIIGDQAFRLCAKLKNISIPDAITEIGHSVFDDTAYINDDANWENGIFYVGNHLIKANTDITSCNIRPGTKLINNDAFSGCNQLETVIIPDGVTRINDYAFNKCLGLRSVTLPESIIYISPTAFQYCDNLKELHISDMDSYMNIDFGYSGKFNLSNPMFFADILHLNGELITSIVVPDYIDTIYSGAFDGCENLENITLPDGITSIGEAAFRGCYNLSSLTIPKNVKSIDARNWANIKKLIIQDLKAYMEVGFSGTKIMAEEIYYQDKLLTELIVPDGITYITDDIFSWWNNYSSSLEKVVIPSSVKYIGENAFTYCTNLKQVEFSKNLLFIDSYAFSGCHNITNVLYDGTKEEWDKILMCNGNFSIKRAQIQFNDSAKKSTKTTISTDGKSFTITPINIEKGKTVILALYDGEKLVEMQHATYEGTTITFTTTKSYTNAKVMVWDDLTTLKPVCEVEEL